MGLDQYLIHRDADGDTVEVGYWRKDNQIHGYFDRLAVERGVIQPGESINLGDDLRLTGEDINDLRNLVRIVLITLGFDPDDLDAITDESMGIMLGEEMGPVTLVDGYAWRPDAVQQEAALELLPPEGGFFFGTYDIDAWYVFGLKDTLKILDSLPALEDNEELYYTAWW